MVSPEAAQRFLATPLLSEVDPESLRLMLDVLVEQRFPAGAALLEQGHPNDHIAFMIEGSGTILRDAGAGREEGVATIHAPTVFGVTSFFRPSPPVVTVRAATPAWLLLLDHPAHERLRRRDRKAAEELALAAVRILAEREDALILRISEYLAQHPDGHPRANEWSTFRARLFETPPGV